MNKKELSNLITRCCDVLRTDDGISGSLHYTEALSWILYLKFFADKEKERRLLAEIEGLEFVPLFKEEFQWEVWTDSKTGATGTELKEFVDRKLIPYLSSLKGATDADPRDVISAIFRNVDNKVVSGYLLKDVIEEIKKINFDVGDEVFSLSHVYEDLLRSMGQGGGTAGEYYTPRPLVDKMVRLISPKIGEKVYDPACGTGGFLAQAHMFMEPQAKTPQLRKVLNESTFFGKEKTPLPFILCLMNLTLHGMDYPQIAKANTLSRDIRQIEDHEKFEIILANPPFGGKEQKLTQKNFPIESNATELLFLQHIEKSLKPGGRAAVVVPEGVLLHTISTYNQVKNRLLTECNLHTILSLPPGVFLPYSPVKTSVIFLKKQERRRISGFMRHLFSMARF